jgi:hypothetical protein
MLDQKLGLYLRHSANRFNTTRVFAGMRRPSGIMACTPALQDLREARAMPLARLWREHLEAGCPSELQGVQIAGSDVVALDAEVTAYVSAVVTQTCRNTDQRVSQRLEEIRIALEQTLTHAREPVAGYCTRLNCLVSPALSRLQTKPN